MMSASLRPVAEGVASLRSALRLNEWRLQHAYESRYLPYVGNQAIGRFLISG